MSKLKGAPPAGWRPSVKGSAGGEPGGGLAAVGQSTSEIRLPAHGAAAPRKPGGERPGGGPGVLGLFGGAVPDYGRWGTEGVPVSPAQAGGDARAAAPPAQPGTPPGQAEDRPRDWGALFEDLDDGGDPGSAQRAPGSARGYSGRRQYTAKAPSSREKPGSRFEELFGGSPHDDEDPGGAQRAPGSAQGYSGRRQYTAKAPGSREKPGSRFDELFGGSPHDDDDFCAGGIESLFDGLETGTSSGAHASGAGIKKDTGGGASTPSSYGSAARGPRKQVKFDDKPSVAAVDSPPREGATFGRAGPASDGPQPGARSPGSAFTPPPRQAPSPAGQRPVPQSQKLILDLNSFLVDLATQWQREGLLPGFSLAGKTNEGIRAWNDRILRRGELLLEDFGGHHVELDLSDCSALCWDFQLLEQFVGALRKDATVTTLRLARNKLGNLGATCVCSSLVHNQALTELDLSGNGIDDEGLRGISAALRQQCTLAKLDLTGNQIGPKGAADLAEGCMKNHSLKELNLSGNRVGDQGAMRLADAVDGSKASPSALTALILKDNPIGPRAAERLVAVFEAAGGQLVTLHVRDRLMTREAHGGPHTKFEQRFTVACSQRGVDIRAVDERPVGKPIEEFDWDQDEFDIELALKLEWLKKDDKEFMDVSFHSGQLKVVIKDETVIDLELYGLLRPEDCVWTMTEGMLRMTLAKAESTMWPALVKV